MASLFPSFGARPWLRSAVAMLGVFLRIDRRRPASWIALCSGALLGWWSAGSPSGGIAPMVIAAILAVAAIGDLPLTLGPPAGRGFAWSWAWERSAWPMAGILAGLLSGWARLESAPFECVGPVLVGCLLASVTVVTCRLSAARAADAASLALLLAAASAAVGASIATRSELGLLASAVVWLLLGAVGWGWWRSQAAAIGPVTIDASHDSAADRAGTLRIDAFPAAGALRQLLFRLAMASGLAAMALWLAVQPWGEPSGDAPAVGATGAAGLNGASVAWALFTAAWFVGLVVPQATLQDGVAGADRWDRLFRSAPSIDRGRPAATWTLRAARPGAVRFAAGVALSQAAILGWPILVSMALSLASPAKAAAPLRIVIGLAVGALAVTGLVAVGEAMRASRETTLAVALAVVAGLLAFSITSDFGA